MIIFKRAAFGGVFMFASYVCGIETSDVGHQETRGIKARNVRLC